MLREGLCALIELQRDMEVVAAARFGDEAVQRFMQHRPHVTLMDLDLPGAAGVQAIRAIRQIDPSACVIGLFTYECDESRDKALQAGARKCLVKDHLNHDLLSYIRESQQSLY